MSKPRSVGAYGSTRGKERQRRKRDARHAQARVARALEEARLHNERIDALIAAGETAPTPPRPTPPPVTRADDAPAASAAPAPPPGPHRLEVVWTLRDVYRMLHQGYSCEAAARRTGYDLEIVEDLLPDDDACPDCGGTEWLYGGTPLALVSEGTCTCGDPDEETSETSAEPLA